MKTASYNGSRKTYLCPATNIIDIKAGRLICQSPSLPPNEEETVTTETKRRRGLFNDDEGSLDTSKSIW